MQQSIDAADLSIEQIAVGDWVVFDVMISHNMLDEFAVLTGDRSPIHMSPEDAQAAGYGARVVHGMLLASLVSTVVGMFLPGSRALLLSQRSDFVEPVLSGSTVTVSARVTQVSAATSAITLSVHVLSGGLLAMKGSAMARVR